LHQGIIAGFVIASLLYGGGTALTPKPKGLVADRCVGSAGWDDTGFVLGKHGA
jgi:hypothetical protein